jgi:AAA ATPase domain
MELTGRRGERGVLDELINAVRAGGSRVLVVRGEPGVGKSALLDYLAGHAAGCRVLRAAGVQSEMELAFAGLHQLLAPVLDRAGRLPVPQRDALRTAFGLSAGPVPGWPAKQVSAVRVRPRSSAALRIIATTTSPPKSGRRTRR